jgi:RimJ/RimL family protein N-acetyltransferase
MLAWVKEPQTIAHVRDESSTGRIDLRAADDPGRHAAVGIIIPDENPRGREYGRAAIELLLRVAVAPINLHKVWLHVYEGTTRAIHLYESIGVVTDGAGATTPTRTAAI